MAAAMLLSACEGGEQENGSVRFDGAVAASSVTIASSPDRCVFSFLYDSFSLEWLPTAGAADPRPQERRIELAAPASAAGKSLSLDIRGAASVPAGSKLTVEVNGESFEVPLTFGEDIAEFTHSITGKARGGDATNVIVLRASAPRPDPERQILLTVDSVDLALQDPEGCRHSDVTRSGEAEATPAAAGS